MAQLKEKVTTLDAHVKAYAGLPPDMDLARHVVEDIEQQVIELEAKRDRLYDGMVERR